MNSSCMFIALKQHYSNSLSVIHIVKAIKMDSPTFCLKSWHDIHKILSYHCHWCSL